MWLRRCPSFPQMYSSRAKAWATRNPRLIKFLEFWWRRYWNLVHWNSPRGTVVSKNSGVNLVLEAYQRFKVSNLETDFIACVDLFRASIEDSMNDFSQRITVIGWGPRAFADETVHRLTSGKRKVVKAKLIYGIPRPDTLLLERPASNLLCGFKLTLDLQSDELLSSQELEGTSFQSPTITGAVDQFFLGSSGKRDGFLEGISSNNPQALADLLDWAGDSRSAQAVMTAISGLLRAGRPMAEIRPWLKIALVASGEARSPINLGGSLKYLSVKEPPWTLCDATTSKRAAKNLVVRKYAILENVNVFSGGTVFDDRTLWTVDRAAHSSLDFVAGSWDHTVGAYSNFSRAFVEAPSSESLRLGKGILLSSRVDSNWFHWLIETLPKLLHIDSHIEDNWPVLVSERLPTSAIESLKLLTSRKIIALDTSEVTRVGKLAVPGPVIFHPDSTMLWDSPQLEIVNSESLLALRQRILSRLGPDTELPKKIFVSRQGHSRGLTNRLSVRKMLVAQDFVEVGLNNLTFSQQVSLFRNASHIVLEGGAAMSNLLFCSEGTAVTVLVGEMSRNYKMPEILCGISRANVNVVFGQNEMHRGGLYLERLHSSYRISLAKLQNHLND